MRAATERIQQRRKSKERNKIIRFLSLSFHPTRGRNKAKSGNPTGPPTVSMLHRKRAVRLHKLQIRRYRGHRRGAHHGLKSALQICLRPQRQRASTAAVRDAAPHDCDGHGAASAVVRGLHEGVGAGRVAGVGGGGIGRGCGGDRWGGGGVWTEEELGRCV